MRWRSHSRSPEATLALGRALGASRPQGLVALIGPLGSGKTVLAKGIAAGLGLDPAQVSSPTFVIANEYPLPGPVRRLVHVDFYRLGSEAEAEALGLVDWLAPDTVVVVEWADRLPGVLPADRLEVRFGAGAASPEARTLEVAALGPEAEAVLGRWRSEVGEEAS